MDTIAGEFSFYPQIVKPLARGEISFEKIEAIRAQACPEASFYSSILNLAKLWPTPCVWIEAKLAHKKGENGNQHSFGFREPPRPSLRAVHASPNEPARRMDLLVIPNFRVPAESIIHRVYYDDLSHAEAVENLALWRSSDGKRLADRQVRVKAKRLSGPIHALILPV